MEAIMCTIQCQIQFKSRLVHSITLCIFTHGVQKLFLKFGLLSSTCESKAASKQWTNKVNIRLLQSCEWAQTIDLVKKKLHYHSQISSRPREGESPRRRLALKGDLFQKVNIWTSWNSENYNIENQNSPYYEISKCVNLNFWKLETW